jgi:uncharacterized membrane protein YidH (DUF202 family)
VSGTEPGADPGAARERTLLAWMRTVLAVAGCALLVARLAQLRHPAAAPAVAGLGCATAVGLAVAATGRYHRAPARGALTAVPRLVCAAAVASLALAAVALAVVVSG